ncbi:hypothetical protein IMSHALPRED_010463 [Imshaugia aleurites]|uniref:DNA (cytosine-5-)-methyltransferase n=1 Tax=Imshaugia aleurites TaxID=172621 RepID=A0A8H3IW44_9LECA|nr:hypothetical protein IMSHALPRED_010463 [Imshaugia aleurites]
MEDSDPPPQAPLADMDVNMGEADALPPGFVRRNPNVINLIDDDGNESDSTLLDNEIGPRVVPQISEARRKRRHTYTRNGHTYEVGRISKGNDGNFVRVTSIKRHCASGAIAIEHVQDNHRRLGTHSYDGRTLKPGKTVELSDSTFLRIVSILENRRTGEICVKGFRFQRNKFLKGHLEFKVNEVTLMTKHESNNVQHIAEQSMETIKLAAVVKIRELVLTNRPFPELSFLGIETGNFTSASAKEYVRANCRLTCRWVYCEDEGVLRRVTDIESDEGCSVPQANLRYNFRGQTTNQDKYTFMDGYSGAGGASSGAQLAGLLVERAFDHNLDTVATYRLNFPFAKCEAISAYDFIMSNENYRCDVLHLSPPCQPFSPAHTRPGPNDERNEATFLTTAELIKKTRPRIVTIEETFGLTRTQNNLDWFNATIQMFTKLGFSVRWKVFNLLDFGLPQPRKRLFIFASW